MGKRTDQAKKKVGRPSHEVSDEDRIKVEAWCVMGLPYDRMASALGISVNTLQKHYADELAHAKDDRNTQIVNSLFQKALKGDTTALIFWCKTQLGWKETQVQEMVLPQIEFVEEDAYEPDYGEDEAQGSVQIH